MWICSLSALFVVVLGLFVTYTQEPEGPLYYSLFLVSNSLVEPLLGLITYIVLPKGYGASAGLGVSVYFGPWVFLLSWILSLILWTVLFYASTHLFRGKRFLIKYSIPLAVVSIEVAIIAHLVITNTLVGAAGV